MYAWGIGVQMGAPKGLHDLFSSIISSFPKCDHVLEK